MGSDANLEALANPNPTTRKTKYDLKIVLKKFRVASSSESGDDKIKKKKKKKKKQHETFR